MKPTFGKTAALKMAKHATVPLPVVKPTVHEEWLQDYLNEHPDIGDIKLLKALEQAMHVTCTRKTMQRWLESHEPITVEPTIAEYGCLLVSFSYPDVRRGYEADFRQDSGFENGETCHLSLIHI